MGSIAKETCPRALVYYFLLQRVISVWNYQQSNLQVHAYLRASPSLLLSSSTSDLILDLFNKSISLNGNYHQSNLQVHAYLRLVYIYSGTNFWDCECVRFWAVVPRRLFGAVVEPRYLLDHYHSKHLDRED